MAEELSGVVTLMNASTLPATHATPQLTRAYLIQVAEAIQRLMPHLAAAGHGPAEDFLRVLSRIATQMGLEASDGGAGTPSIEGDDAASEGKAFCEFNALSRTLLSEVLAASSGAVRPFDAPLLERFLQDHPLGGPQLRIEDARMLAGGRSKITALVTQTGARDLPHEMIFRQDWSSSVVGTSVLGEFELLKQLHARHIAVPKPLLMNAQREGTAKPYILVGRCVGKPYGDDQRTLPPTEKPLLQLAEQLGRLQAIDPDVFLATPEIKLRDYTLEQLRETLAKYTAVVQQLGRPRSALAHAVISWLEENAERAASGPRSLVHGDLGFHNSLCQGDELIAILDWELSHVGPAAYDLGYLRNAIVDDAQWSRFVQVYRAAGGLDVEPFLIDYFHLFGCIWFYQLVLQAQAGLIAGVIRDITVATACADILPAIMERMATSFERVTRSG
ncbi:MAG: phosphotransferase [Steroidobacteraceae bacterium]